MAFTGVCQALLCMCARSQARAHPGQRLRPEEPTCRSVFLADFYSRRNLSACVRGRAVDFPRAHGGLVDDAGGRFWVCRGDGPFIHISSGGSQVGVPGCRTHKGIQSDRPARAAKNGTHADGESHLTHLRFL